MSVRILRAALAAVLPLCVCLAGSLSPTSVLAASYYVSPSGDDGNSGFQSSPWRTLQHAANQVGPGDVVYVYDGTYVGFDIRGIDGTSSNPIAFLAWGDNVVINDANAKTPDNINIEGVDYVLIDGFIVRDSPRVGIRCVLSRGCIIRNNDVGNSYRHGILSGFSPEILVENNKVHGTTIEDGIYISNSEVEDDYPIVRGNEVWATKQTGIHVNGDCHSGGDGVLKGVVIENNYIHDCGDKGMDFSSVIEGVIRNNLFISNGESGGGAGAIHLFAEPGCPYVSTDNVIVNNTIVDDEIAGIRFTGGSDGNYVFNNIIICPNDSEIADEVGGNHIDGSSNLTRNTVSGVFMDYNGRDFHLTTGSPALDNGVLVYLNQSAPVSDKDGYPRPYGGTIDVGAYEKVGQSAVAIVSFDAEVVERAVVLSWVIGSADELQGFNIYRSQGPNGVTIQMNAELLPPSDGFSYTDTDVVPGKSYTYRLGAIDRDGEFFSIPARVEIPRGAIVLEQNTPNPFNPSTNISFELDTDGFVELTVYDAAGRTVRNLAKGRRTSGRHTVTWNGVNDAGVAVGSGVYFYRLRAGKEILRRKAVLLK